MKTLSIFFAFAIVVIGAALWWLPQHEARLEAQLSQEASEQTYHLTLQTDAAIAELDERFLSVALDTSVLLGGHWWGDTRGGNLTVGGDDIAPINLADDTLLELTRNLSPAYLRIGGTEADKAYYHVTDEAQTASGKLVLTADRWAETMAFARSAGMDVMFTLNAGFDKRDAAGKWQPDNAQTLVAHAYERGDPVAVWELGNEVNVYGFTQGQEVDAGTYWSDLQTTNDMIDAVGDQAQLAGFGSLFVPRVGEPNAMLTHDAQPLPALDILTWHYYPQQSERCLLRNEPAQARTLLNHSTLNDIQQWAQTVTAWRDQFAPQAQVWLGEIGPALCGGQPSLSDRFVSTLWWLDLLGQMAALDQTVVIRQALIGSDYGLIDADTLQPNPDYWASLLWKQLMGTRALGVALTPEPAPSLRAYAHCTPNQSGTVSLLLMNTDSLSALDVTLPALSARKALYRLSAPNPLAKAISLNGELLSLPATGRVPDLAPEMTDNASITLPPYSAVFVSLPEARVAACQ